ncbi:hypothetical protein [Noviherbaspirillum sp. ST9]|uniref:hypothetical protein n=1 Tax=Noviherbaspirillum sp. ST9 TaxID=3401606 RepID=UPI003B58AB15
MKWITAHNLQQWAESLAARTVFPGLIADLVAASVPDITAFRFPNREKGQVRGFDGVLEATGVPPFVPDGASIWEFGVNGDVIGKADKDFKKRTEELDAEVRASTTFVFATPRTWDRPQKQITEWLNEKRALGAWKGVEYFDGAALEHWLDMHPAVAARYARYELGLSPHTGAYSSNEFWDEFSTRFAPALVEDVLLAGRESQAAELIRLLGDGGSKLAYAADSADEVIAFAIAAIRRAEPEVRQLLETRVLVVESADAARQLAVRKGLIFLPRGQARSFVGLLAQAGPTVVSAGADDQRSHHEVLTRPTSSQLAKSFVSMGITESEGYELARRCGRSLAVLARQIPSGTAEPPEWLQSSDALIPALLAGAWKPSVKADADVLTALGGRATYEEVEAPLRKLTKLKDPPVDRVDDVWTMRSSVDAFLHLGHLLGGEHLQRFAEQAKSVFSQITEPPKAEDVFRLSKSRVDQHSTWLREGMMTTMLHMAALHEKAGFVVTGSTPQYFVDQIVRNLPGLSSNHRLLGSLGDKLPLLAEAAPVPFFEALERLLEGDAENIKAIFSEQDSFFAPQSSHTGLLWALELLAWDADYLLRSAMCLAKLAAIDPGGKLSNRPINSLRDILLSWSPHTNATYQRRISVLAHVVRAMPSIAWPLLVKLLPQHHDSVSPTQKPIFAEASPGGQETLTYGIVWETQSAIVDLAVENAGLMPERWATLIEALSQLQPDSFERVLIALEDCMSRQTPKELMTTWDALRKELNKHRAFSGAEWALRDAPLQRLEALVAKFQPDDPILLNTWLFDDWMPDVPGKLNDDEPMEAIEDARTKALQDVVIAYGFDGLAMMAERVKLPIQMTTALRRLALDEMPLYGLISRLLGMDGECKSLGAVLIAQAFVVYGSSWAASIRNLISDLQLSPTDSARLFLAFEDTRPTWELVSTFGAEIDAEYWRQKSASGFTGTLDDLHYAITRYQEHGRTLGAIEATHRRLKDVDSPTLLSLLDSAVVEINASGGNSANMLRYYIEHIFEELERRTDVMKDELARMEFIYLPFFHRRKRPLTLHKMMAESPEFFVSTICAVFKPENGESPALSDSERRHATAAYELLNGLDVLPGQVGAQVDFAKLSAWCDEVQRRSADVDRRSVTDGRIGHLLAHAPVDPDDQVWPHKSVRRLLEQLSSDRVENAIRLERFNMRGVYSKAVGEGGQQERDLAEQARAWSRAVPAFPRTATMLAAIAQMWINEGEASDARAAKEALRW